MVSERVVHRRVDRRGEPDGEFARNPRHDRVLEHRLVVPGNVDDLQPGRQSAESIIRLPKIAGRLIQRAEQ